MRALITTIPIALAGFAAYALAFRAIPPGGLAASLDEALRVLGAGPATLLALAIASAATLLITSRRQQAI